MSSSICFMDEVVFLKQKWHNYVYGILLKYIYSQT